MANNRPRRTTPPVSYPRALITALAHYAGEDIVLFCTAPLWLINDVWDEWTAKMK